ncbi:hypothetical protein ACO2Q0_11020 [Phenylobacterium sp. VNQ135]|uniref:hypothetical protein n=1 Tax=Phenylobacterium sp. VNQ135 TaxID=3400922 RepID=UPI003BFE0704
MSDAAAPAVQPFSPRAVLILVVVGIVAFAGLGVLSAYAPELRGGEDGQAHALSRSAVGYAGAVILLRELDVPVTVSRVRPPRPTEAVTVLTPDFDEKPADIRAYPKGALTLIVLPKWAPAPDPLRRGLVRKGGLVTGGEAYHPQLASYAAKTVAARRQGVSRPTLRGANGFLGGEVLPLGPIDQLQTLSGDGWEPLLTDERGQAVLVRSRKSPGVWVLADPDLLNNQGLAHLPTARAAVAMLQAARGTDRAVVFDVTLNGFEHTPGLGRLALTPPWLAATLCAVAAAVLMGLHALARFGAPERKARAIALGSTALVDNTAGLVRMAKKEAELASAYAAMSRSRVAHAAAGHGVPDDMALEELARRRGAASPGQLSAEAEAAATPHAALEAARRLYQWRKEMTRGRG